MLRINNIYNVYSKPQTAAPSFRGVAVYWSKKNGDYTDLYDAPKIEELDDLTQFLEILKKKEAEVRLNMYTDSSGSNRESMINITDEENHKKMAMFISKDILLIRSDCGDGFTKSHFIKMEEMDEDHALILEKILEGKGQITNFPIAKESSKGKQLSEIIFPENFESLIKNVKGLKQKLSSTFNLH